MNMRQMALSCVMVSALVSVSHVAVATTPEALDQLFEVMNIEQTTDDAIRKTVELQAQQNPALKQFEPELLAFVRKNSSFKNNEKEIRAMYTSKFTEKEILEIAEFYRTPIGRKTIALLPEIAAEAVNLGMRKATADLPNFQKILAAKTEALKATKEKEAKAESSSTVR